MTYFPALVTSNLLDALNLNKSLPAANISSHSPSDKNNLAKVDKSPTPDNKFWKIGNSLYNKKYVKSLHCNDKMCELILANTESAGGNGWYKYDTKFIFQHYSIEYKDAVALLTNKK